MIDQRLAQDIVNKAIEIVGVNVNIMDKDAIVIASGSSDRIGKFHEPAQKVINSGSMLTVDGAASAQYADVKPGVTLPIIFRGEIVGAVGMTGNPAVVSEFSELVCYTTELMLEQAHQKDEAHLVDLALGNLLHDSLSGSESSGEYIVDARQENQGPKTTCPWAVFALIPRGEEKSLNQKLQYVIQCQRLAEHLKAELTRQACCSPPLVHFYKEQLAVLVPCKQTVNLAANGDRLKELAHVILGLARAENSGIAFNIGIGGYCVNLKDLARIFTRAVEAVKMGKAQAPTATVFLYQDYVAEHLLSYIPDSVAADYKHLVLGNIRACPVEQRELLLDALETYFEEEMNLTETARRLYIHRNTLMQRFKKVEELSGLCPQKFSDAIRLKLALMLAKSGETFGG